MPLYTEVFYKDVGLMQDSKDYEMANLLLAQHRGAAGYISILWDIEWEIGDRLDALTGAPANVSARQLPTLCAASAEYDAENAPRNVSLNTYYTFALVWADYAARHDSTTIYAHESSAERFYYEPAYGDKQTFASMRHWLITESPCADYLPYEPFPSPSEPLSCENYEYQDDAWEEHLYYWASPESRKLITADGTVCGYPPERGG